MSRTARKTNDRILQQIKSHMFFLTKLRRTNCEHRLYTAIRQQPRKNGETRKYRRKSRRERLRKDH